MPAWRGILAGLVLIGLGAGLMYVLFTDDRAGGAPVPTLESGTTGLRTAEASTTVIVTAPTLTTTTTQVMRVTSTSTTPPRVELAMEEALAAWGVFAVTGRMRDLDGHFVSGGPQRRELRKEAAAIREDPPGPPGYTVTTGEVLVTSVSPTDVVLQAEVVWSRIGEETRTYLWDIQMRLSDGVWKLFTIENAG